MLFSLVATVCAFHSLSPVVLYPLLAVWSRTPTEVVNALAPGNMLSVRSNRRGAPRLWSAGDCTRQSLNQSRESVDVSQFNPKRRICDDPRHTIQSRGTPSEGCPLQVRRPYDLLSTSMACSQAPHLVEAPNSSEEVLVFGNF